MRARLGKSMNTWKTPCENRSLPTKTPRDDEEDSNDTLFSSDDELEEKQTAASIQ